MRVLGFYKAFKAVGYAVLLLMLIGILYAGYITISHWHGIGV